MSNLFDHSRLSADLVSGLQEVDRPIEQARGLPSSCYIDPDGELFERRQLFHRSWACIGFAKDLPKAGDARPIEFAGRPLLLLRTREGEIRVFENVCRHRGMALASEPTRFKHVIRCPYHSWCYEHSGELKVTPHVGGPGHNTHDAIDRSSLALTKIRSAVWWDLIFVDLSGEAEPFEDYIAPLEQRWGEFAFDRLVHGGPSASFTLEVGCNWKLAVENYCESYHLPWVHPGLNSYSRLEDHYDIIEENRFSGQGTRVYRPMLTDDGARFPAFEGLSSKWDAGAEYVALYPNLLLGIHRDHAFAIQLEPKAVDRTLEHVAIYYVGEAALGDAYGEMRRRMGVLWRGVFEEDIFAVEGMQKGRHAPSFDGGRFSPAMDGSTHAFHRWVARRLRGEPA
ncbi:MAG: aromatic ring-hydroxylating dioxygenase subunit alpha [Geminicoccaceae bacterium]